ncbi:S8 family serine peptidase [Amycolatopsis sp. SID8362]|uniref:S8 family serine peptidase n=1 Tax=Amycolatopsis sp. SID8362 TaxID=2690346 RepID=UPI001368453B|nr:S8 family serine peptidase [Amycolatopsis sp. SID8362]NBH10497.1 S8 family serine peptidase [Amycolatopsis sp. SID8362]NED47191.1 S8 family serine peptidase [Amycolatopsis sp. SID8362]
MHWRSRVLVLACAGALAAGTAGAADAAPGRPAAPAPAGVERHSVTLLTGDVVQVERQPGGKQAATVQPAPGREKIRFHQQEVDGHLSVFPEDVAPRLGSKQVDRTLFDVTELIAEGYADEQSATLPLILTYRKGTDLRKTTAKADLGVTLTSVNGRSARASKANAAAFWASSGDVERISLDRKVRASLDRSVPQIGAPEAWAAGYDGTGTTVAVLDTGYDPTHPDLAGRVREAVNFTTSPDTTDHFGHGTHVASTIAGSGAASGGKLKGAAPGAELLVGKVLDDDGFGYESWVLAGMEWAAHSGAKAVNMSLGGGATDGTDALSLGLDALSAQTGTLFVVAAGNDGDQGAYTIGSPGTAAAALTVGAVGRDERLASFSSRGPRLGDNAVKPDITAPGVGIVAARAAGTAMGDVVDDHYTAASGTSMATPHVAGAAAILAQQHPDWTGSRLKDALASTSLTAAGLSVFEQGGGRVDVARAVKQQVFATGTLDLGAVEDGKAAVSKEVTYTNAGTTPVSLKLALDAKSLAGVPAADGIRLDKSTLDVPAGGTAKVVLTGDPAKLAAGTYSGRLTATADGVLVHTAVGADKTAPKHKVTISALDLRGKPAVAPWLLMYGEDYRYDVNTWLGGDSLTLELGAGVYYLTAEVDGGGDGRTVHQVVLPEIRVTGDTNLVLDARKAVKVEVETPKPSEQAGIWSYYTYRELGPRRIANYAMQFDYTRELWVTPTPKVTTGAFEFGSRWSRIAPPLTATVLGDRDPLTTRYLAGSPKLDGWRLLPAVSAGQGKPADFQRVNVRGKVAVVDPDPADYNSDDVSRAAAAAGAAMVFIVVPDGWSGASVPSISAAPSLPVPTVQLDRDEGVALLARLKWLPALLSLRGIPVSPYLYDVVQTEHDRIPERIVHRVTAANTATVTTHYRQTGSGGEAKEQRFAWKPWQDFAVNEYQRRVATPSTREEYVSSGDTLWQHRVKHGLIWDEMSPLQGGMTTAPRTYQDGEKLSEDWFAPVVRPAIPRGVPGLDSAREGDHLRIRIPEFVDSQAGHYGFNEGDDQAGPAVTSAKLFRDGELVSEQPYAFGTFPAGADPATYRLDLSVRRDSPEWLFGTSTRTSWTFRSARSASPALLPLLQLDYAVDADSGNRLPAGRKARIGLTARFQDGMAAPDVRSMKAWVSYDDGKTWRVADVKRTGKSYEATVDHPPLGATNSYVALRVQATDSAGNSVDQTVLRAYGLSSK